MFYFDVFFIASSKASNKLKYLFYNEKTFSKNYLKKASGLSKLISNYSSNILKASP